MLTQEQAMAIDALKTNKNGDIIAVNAVAGSGKTTTAKAVIEAIKPINGVYTAFNKAIVQDSCKKFGNIINTKTIHALAYNIIKPKNIKDIEIKDIKEDLYIDEKLLIIEELNNFFLSKHISIDDFYYEKEDKKYKDFVKKYANKMLEGSIPITFSFLLKKLHILMYLNKISLEYDLFILDECQDVSSVMLEIFKLIKSDKKIILGDKYQNIYSFTNSINAFEELDNLNLFYLTKSFRCNKSIANNIQKYGENNLDSNFNFKGNNSINNDLFTVYLSRANASIINRIYSFILENKKFKLTRTVYDIFSLPLAISNVILGKKIMDNKYKYFELLYDIFINEGNNKKNFIPYLIQETNNVQIKSMCSLLFSFINKKINIYEVYKTANKMLDNKNSLDIISTVHTFKGLEANTVYIEDDLNKQTNSSILNLLKNKNNNEKIFLDEKGDKENLNVYYVALSRAKNNILNQQVF